MIKNLTDKEFKILVEEIHPFFDFSKSIFIDRKDKEKIKYTCLRHGEKQGRANDLLRGKGCKECGEEKRRLGIRKGIYKFLEQAKIKHGDKYDYSKVKFLTVEEKITLTCNNCGTEFTQTVHSHLQGNGCRVCGNERRIYSMLSNTKDFVEKSLKIHDNKYDYSKVNYKHSKEKVTITCPIHGDFEQIPVSHLNGGGCKKCANEYISNINSDNIMAWGHSSWEKVALKSKNFDSYKVYVIECFNENERFIKIGKTFKTVERRFYGKGKLPYKYKILKEIIFDTSIAACEYEKDLKCIFKSGKYIPEIFFAGRQECFNTNIDINKNIYRTLL